MLYCNCSLSNVSCGILRVKKVLRHETMVNHTMFPDADSLSAGGGMPLSGQRQQPGIQ